MIGTKVTFHHEGYTRSGKVVDKVRVPQVSQALQMIVVPDCYLVDMESKQITSELVHKGKLAYLDKKVVCISPEKILTIET